VGASRILIDQPTTVSERSRSARSRRRATAGRRRHGQPTSTVSRQDRQPMMTAGAPADRRQQTSTGRDRPCRRRPRPSRLDRSEHRRTGSVPFDTGLRRGRPLGPPSRVRSVSRGVTERVASLRRTVIPVGLDRLAKNAVRNRGSGRRSASRRATTAYRHSNAARLVPAATASRQGSASRAPRAGPSLWLDLTIRRRDRGRAGRRVWPPTPAPAAGFHSAPSSPVGRLGLKTNRGRGRYRPGAAIGEQACGAEHSKSGSARGARDRDGLDRVSERRGAEPERVRYGSNAPGT
jgi:hypothetical protein